MTHSFPTRRCSDLIDIAAREDDERALGGLDLAREQGGERDRAAGLDHQPQLFRRPALRGADIRLADRDAVRSEEHTSELQSLMRIPYAVFSLKKKHIRPTHTYITVQLL